MPEKYPDCTLESRRFVVYNIIVHMNDDWALESKSYPQCKGVFVMIYTSYFGQLKNLERDGIEPIAISRSQPKGFAGQKRLDLAPTWAMLKMSNAQYDHLHAD